MDHFVTDNQMCVVLLVFAMRYKEHRTDEIVCGPV